MAIEIRIKCHCCDEHKPPSHFLAGHKMCLACEQDMNMAKREKAHEQYPRARRDCENCED
jgi:uncharacterized protein (DUF983 family)